MGMYHVKGRLRGYFCDDCFEDLSDLEIYAFRVSKETTRTFPNPKDAQQVLGRDFPAANENLLLGKGKTNDSGEYELALSDAYNGEDALLLVGLARTVPGLKSGKGSPEAVTFSIAYVHPEWSYDNRQLAYATVEHSLAARFWCYVRSLFDAWVICGRVIDCASGRSIAGVEVVAFDADWITDDELGKAVTDATGHFRINYTSADFRKTFLSPFINTETPFPPFHTGPDVYFKVTSPGGVVLIDETRSDGHAPGRENAPNCLCVRLCVKDAPPFENPYFFQIGDFNIGSDINPATGLTRFAKLGHGGPDFAFFGSLKLKGFCPKTHPADASRVMYYRFLFADASTPAARTPVTGPYLEGTVMGARIVPWDLFGTGVSNTYQDIVIANTATPSAPDSLPAFPVVPPGTSFGPVPPHVLTPDAFGWIRVDQLGVDSGFYGPLLRLNTQAIAGLAGGVSLSSGDVAGAAVSAPQNGKKIRIYFQTSTVPHPTNGNPSAAEAASALFNEQMLVAEITVNNWLEAGLMDIVELAGGGCTPVGSSVNIRYTVDHQFIRSWELSVSSNATGSVSLASGTTPRGNHAVVTYNPPLPCAYEVNLVASRKLTDGENDDTGRTLGHALFCR